MITPPYPDNEAERINVLHALLILDTGPEERFDAITVYARSRFNVDSAVVSLVDSERQWFKSACGLDAKETPRSISFCGHAILQSGVYVVKDALESEIFYDNPLVVGPPYIRFYAGAPLVLGNGYTMGTLCLLDSKPRSFDLEDQQHLADLARMVSIELEKPDFDQGSDLGAHI